MVPRLLLPVGLLLLSSCVAAPPCAPGGQCYGYSPGPAAPYYAPPPGSYAPPPAYAPPQAYAPQGGDGPDALTYDEGVPYDTYDGAVVPLVFLPAVGGWGFYDGFHRWHGAPPRMRDRLEQRFPGGRGLPPPNSFHGEPGGYPGSGRYCPDSETRWIRDSHIA